MRPTRSILTLLLAAMAFSPVARAQSTLSQNQDGFNGEKMDGFMNMEPTKDSTVVERSVSHEYNQWKIDTETGLPVFYEPDTIHHFFQKVHLTDGMDGTYSNLANVGSPRLSRLFSERKEPGEFTFISPYSFWAKAPTDFLFTDTKSPHLNLAYYKGGNKQHGEERIKGYFVANFNKRKGIGIDMDYLLGRGSYENQATSMFDARVYTYYRGDLYNMYASVNTDEMKMAENGGIQDRRYISDPESMAEGRKQFRAEDIPFRLYNHWNNINQKQALFNQNLTINAKTAITDSIGDSTFTYFRKIQVAKVAHTLQAGTRNRNYIYYQTPANYYARQYLRNDSTDRLRNLYITNTLSISTLEGFSKWAFAGVSAYIRHDFNRFTMPDTLGTDRSGEYMRRFNMNNLTVGGHIGKESGENLLFSANAETTILGDYMGDFRLDGDVRLSIPIRGRQAHLGANAELSNKTAPFLHRNFHSTFSWWDEDFDRVFRSRIGGFLEIEKTNSRLDINVENISNMVYFENAAGNHTNNDGVSLPVYDIRARQHSGSIQVASATLRQGMKLGPIHFDNLVSYQISSNSRVLPLPALNVNSDLYLKFVYAKRLAMEVGATATYFTEYEAPGYCPATGDFFNQNQQYAVKVGNYPLVTGYVNCELRGVRFYVMYYHANDGIMANRNSFFVPGYPINPGLLKFGINWTFFD